MKKTKLMLGDNIESLKKLPDNSVDSVVTDPPYGLSAPKNSGKTSQGGFMNKKWDYDVPSVEFWMEVYRVLKPGGHILSFGGTRTYHRMVVNIEDAGFEIRDQIQWIYGSGFPKSLNIGKAVDKLQGNEREVVGDNPNNKYKGKGSKSEIFGGNIGQLSIIDKGQSKYEGWGTALKPANEPICVARKPLSEKSVAENVLKWGTGGINVDGCRVSGIDEANAKRLGKSYKSDNSNLGNSYNLSNEKYKDNITVKVGGNLEGRFPANIILECICDEVIKGEKGEIKKSDRRFEILQNKSEGKVERIENYGDKGDIHTDPNCPCRLLDEQSGESKSVKGRNDIGSSVYGGNSLLKSKTSMNNTERGFSDKGGASRFFYQAKVSKAERNMGLDGFDEKEVSIQQPHNSKSLEERYEMKTKNNHPTVKPINLMAYLCRLITPEGGIVLDPFMGSGSTGVSAQLEGFRFVGMEMDSDYFKIAEARISSYEKYEKFKK